MPDTLPALIPTNGVESYRMSSNAADICGDIVKATAKDIQGRKYVCVEGWQAIAVAHGCAATSCNVERVEGGVRATGQVRRMDTGQVIAEAEGFVGEDEPVWFGGEGFSFGKRKTFPKRADFAIRAMAQTRAISRACRSAFAHVVVLIDKNLGTTPAEEMMGVIDHQPDEPLQKAGAEGTAGAGTQFRPERRLTPAGGGQGQALSQAIREGEQDGLTQGAAPKATPKPATSTRKKLTAEEYAAKIRDGVDKRIGLLKSVSNWTRQTLDQVWKDNEDWIGWMSDPANDVLAEYERFTVAFADAELNIKTVELA